MTRGHAGAAVAGAIVALAGAATFGLTTMSSSSSTPPPIPMIGVATTFTPCTTPCLQP